MSSVARDGDGDIEVALCLSLIWPDEIDIIGLNANAELIKLPHANIPDHEIKKQAKRGQGWPRVARMQTERP